MTRTKWLHRALLGGAALSVMATGAQADELAALKAQLEALQARVSQLETQPAPTLPQGASLLTVRKGQLTSNQILPLSQTDRLYGEGLVGRDAHQQGYTIAVTPTADIPAPVSEVTVSGVIRARLLYLDDARRFVDDDDDFSNDEDYSGFDVNARGRLVVEGKTETAVGEVGGTIRLEAGGSGPDSYDQNHFSAHVEDVDMDIAWGYWQITPNWQLGGGYAASTGSLQAGVDWQHNDDMTGFVNAFSNDDEEQIRITFQSGGLTFAVALEDNDSECSGDYDCVNVESESDIPAVAAYALFDTGSFVIAAAANWANDDRATDACNGECDDNWSAGIGVNGKFEEAWSWTVAVAAGEGNGLGLQNFSLSPFADDDWWGVSGGFIFGFATAMSLQFSAGYAELEHEGDDFDDGHESLDVAATLFWDPVDQLTLGFGAGWHDNEVQAVEGDDYWVAGFGAYFRF
jgi:hypothetical protein